MVWRSLPGRIRPLLPNAFKVITISQIQISVMTCNDHGLYEWTTFGNIHGEDPIRASFSLRQFKRIKIIYLLPLLKRVLQKQLVGATRYQIYLRGVLFVFYDLLFYESHRSDGAGVFLYDLNWLIVVVWIVDLYEVIPGRRGKEIATANSTLIVA